MNMNGTNLKIKEEIIKQYGTYENFAKKTGYARMYICNVLNGKNPMSDDFKKVLEISLGIKLSNDSQISSKNMYGYLIESSSLRQDLLNEMDTILKDIINNIDLKDEICARVKKKTYDFIKNWKGEKKLL